MTTPTTVIIRPNSHCRKGHPKFKHSQCQEYLANRKPQMAPKARHLMAIKDHGFHSLVTIRAGGY